MKYLVVLCLCFICYNSSLAANNTRIYNSLYKPLLVLPYEDSIVVNGNPCDFIFYLEVQFADTLSYQWYFENVEIPNATDYRIQLNGQNPSVPGLYKVIITGPSGELLELEYQLDIPVIYTSDSFYICPGDSIFVGIKYWDEPGSYTIKYLDTFDPCQIQLEFFIELYDAYEFLETDTICNDETYFWRGNNYNKSGTFTEYNSTIEGCDSNYVLQLFKWNNIQNNVNISICTGQSYFFQNQELTSSGNFSDTLISKNGCDSIINLQLSISDIIVGDTIYVIIEENETYLYNNQILNEAGIYQDTLSSSGGCDSIAFLDLSFNSPCSLDFQVETIQDYCSEGSNSILIFPVPETTKTISYSIDGGLTFRDNGLFENIDEGIYSIIINDSSSCVWNLEPILFESYNALIGELTQNITIKLGDTVQLSVKNVNFTPISYKWNSKGLDMVDNGSTLLVSPYQSTEYEVKIFDENGCSITLTTRILIDDSDIYIPNIFTPNNDGINDYFSIFAPSDDLRNIEKLAIYDRWGNLVYTISNQSLQSFKGWDGKFNNRLVKSGTYAFYFILSDLSNKQKIYNGNISVVY